MAWACGILFWIVRLCVRPRKRLYRTPLDYALLGFFILTFVSALASYDALISIGKLRGASLFTIVYLVAENVTQRRVLRWLVFTLIASCMINVIYVMGERAVGRGVKVEGVSTQSPLYAAGVRDGDTLLEVDGRALHDAGRVARGARRSRCFCRFITGGSDARADQDLSLRVDAHLQRRARASA